eukprot:scaffold29630_cov28-Attheya_sp.AAC.1
MATSQANHLATQTVGGPAADGLPYRRRGLVRVLLTHLQMLSLNVFGWTLPTVVLQANPFTSETECFKHLGFSLLDYEYFIDDTVPDCHGEDIPFKVESSLWTMFIQQSSKIRYETVNTEERHFRFYMATKFITGQIIVRKKMVPLQEFMAVRATLDMHWMQELTLVAKNRKKEA